MNILTVAVIAILTSLVLSAILAWVILPPTRSALRTICPTGEGVVFWTRFTVLMLLLGPLIVTLVFGVPSSEVAQKVEPTDILVRVLTAALVGCFLTLGGIGLRIGTLRPSGPATQANARKSDDAYFR